MKYEYGFANVKGISNKRKKEIADSITDFRMLYNIEEIDYKSLGIKPEEKDMIYQSLHCWDVENEYRKMQEKEIRCITMSNPEYPKRLKLLPGAPYALYVKGMLPAEDRKTVAIIGARSCSPYGENMARTFAEKLAEAGVEIISGMAVGVDSAGQRGALKAGGKSYAVLGSGVDICYPKEAFALYMDLSKNGGLISEYPIGTNPLKQHFPARNRIISGLADAILVIEAKERSGSLITVDMALEQGKDVYALPGPINSALSQGCNRLIKQGAELILSPEDLLEELGMRVAEMSDNKTRKKIVLETAEDMVYSCLDFRPQNLNDIMERAKMPVSQLLDILVSLELRGLIKEISKNYYAVVEEL